MKEQAIVIIIALLTVILGLYWFQSESNMVGFFFTARASITKDYPKIYSGPLELEPINVDGEVGNLIMKALSKGSTFFIGPPRSYQGEKVLPYLKKYRLRTFSPTISSNELIRSGYIYSLYPSNYLIVAKIVDILKKLDSKKVLLFLDNNNLAYSNDFKHILDVFPGKVVIFEENQTLRNIDIEDCDTVVLTTIAVDSASIIKTLKTLRKDLKFVVSDAGLAQDLISFGGDNVEGVYGVYSVNITKSNETFEKILIDEIVQIFEERKFISVEQFDRFLQKNPLKLKDGRVAYYTANGFNFDIYTYIVKNGKLEVIENW